MRPGVDKAETGRDGLCGVYAHNCKSDSCIILVLLLQALQYACCVMQDPSLAHQVCVFCVKQFKKKIRLF